MTNRKGLPVSAVAAVVMAALTACGSWLGAASDPGAAATRPTTTTSLTLVGQTPTATPLPQAGLRLGVVGDFGTGGAAEHAVADRMCVRHRAEPYDLVLTTGDNVYPTGAPERFDEAFFDPFACLIDDGVDFRAVLGNHDVQTDGGRPELEEPAFGMKGRNYILRSRGVRLVMTSAYPLEMRWLRRATRASAEDRWTIVVFHPPVYSPGTNHGSTPGFRPRLPRLFQRRGVDLVLNGHDHLYAVTKPLRRIRYVVTGGGGAPLYRCGDAWFSERCASRHHFLEVESSDDEIVVRAVSPSGRVFDSFRTAGR